MAFDHLLVASVLRKEGTGKYWTHLTILQALIDLTFQRYEGSKATSGVVYTSEPDLFTKQLESTGYTYEPFARPHEFSRQFFSAPASYRYVDGRNAFYVVDHTSRALGVIRSQYPERHNLVDRCSALHVEPLVRHMPGRVWCAYVAFNDDVQVRAAHELAFCWTANRWNVNGDSLVRNALSDHKMILSVALPLARTVRALSELRKGALILVPNDEASVPHTVGQIDTSALSATLNHQLESMTFLSAYRVNAALQVLSSDGLTIIANDGRLLSCGRIIDLANTTKGSGGGRTQAAIAGSHYGLTIKVSEDGPITAFRAGRKLFTC